MHYLLFWQQCRCLEENSLLRFRVGRKQNEQWVNCVASVDSFTLRLDGKTAFQNSESLLDSCVGFVYCVSFHNDCSACFSMNSWLGTQRVFDQLSQEARCHTLQRKFILDKCRSFSQIARLSACSGFRGRKCHRNFLRNTRKQNLFSRNLKSMT